MTSKRLQTTLAGLVITAAVTILLWFGGQLTPPSLMELLPQGVLRIGVDGSHPPFSTIGADGLYGFEIDLGQRIGELLGVSVHFVPLGFDGLYDALRTEQVDLLLSALPVDPQRMDAIAYTVPYFNAGMVLVSEDASLTMEAMSGRSLAFEYGSEAHSEVNRWQRRIAAFDLLPYESSTAALDAARLGYGDAALVDVIAARLYLRQRDDWQPSVREITVLPLAGAATAQRRGLVILIDRVIQTLQQNGELDAIMARWL